jgi:hypothetical protein
MFDSLSERERELLDAISSAQAAENAVAARKASTIREFALLRAATLTSVGDVEPERVERKIVAEVATACRVSPFQGRRRLHLARDLHLGLDHVRGLFAAGELADDAVLKVVAATAHLDPAACVRARRPDPGTAGTWIGEAAPAHTGLVDRRELAAFLRTRRERTSTTSPAHRPARRGRYGRASSTCWRVCRRRPRS